MNVIMEQINSAGNAFVDFAVPMLLQSGVLIIILLFLDLFLKKRIRAVFRYWIWMIVLLKLVLPTTLSSPTSPAYWLGDDLYAVVDQEPTAPEKSEPAFPITGKSKDTPKLPETASVPARVVESIQTDPAPPLPAIEVAALPATPMPSITWQGLVLLLWLAVVAAMALLLVQRAFFVKGLIAQSEDAGAEILEILEQGCRQMGVRRTVLLRLSPVAASPSVCGLFRPAILIPQSLASKLDSKHLRSIILHELAHIKRGDLWVSLFQTVLQIIYVYNPMLWVANAMIRKIREEAVDETVLVAMGEQAEDYPRTLLDVSRLTFSRPALSLRLIGVVESKKALTGRIKHMSSRSFPKTAKLGIAGLLGVVITASILLPMARAQKDDAASSVFTYEGQFKLHKPLSVGIQAGTAENPKAVRIDWIRFDKTYGNAWGVTARVGWSPEMDSSWQLRVELLDEKGRVLRHSRDEATEFTTKSGRAGRDTMHYAELDMEPMHDQGRRHAKRFRVHLEPWPGHAREINSAESRMHTLEVVVIDQKSGKPVPGAAVMVTRFYLRDTYREDKTLYTTNPQGSCQVEFATGGLVSIKISAQKPGFASIEKSWPGPGRSSSTFGRLALAGLPKRHVLEMVHANSMGGIVRNTEGDPIEGVQVRLYSHTNEPSGTISVRRTVRTDVDGRWQVEDIPIEVDSVTVALKHPVYGGANGRSTRITGQSLLDARAFKYVQVLQKSRIITGNVLDERGEPVTSATVMLALRSGNDVRRHALTNESGSFELAFVVNTPYDKEPAALIAEAPGYAPAERMIYPTSNLDAIEFRLIRGRSVKCRVVDTSGKPVVGAWTVVHPLSENKRFGLWHENTDDQGEFQVPNVPKNDLEITVGKPGYITVRDFVVGQAEDEVVITMKRELRVHGVVTDAESGKPITNFEIAAVYTWQNRPRTSDPAAFVDGTYELTFNEERSEPLQLQVYAVGYEPATSQEFRVDEGQLTFDFRLVRSSTYDETTAGLPREQIKPTGPRRITGIVHDEQGNPVSNAIVSTMPWIAEEATTDSNGAFMLRTIRTSSMGSDMMPPREETTHIIVRHKDRNLAVAIELDGNATAVDVKLNPGVILTGKVVDLGGKGIAGAKVDLRFYDSGTIYGSRDATKADSQGHYEIRAVPSDQSYYVFATAEGYGEQYVDVQTAEAEDDRMELEPLVLAAADLSISGVVVDVENRPIAGARVNAYGRGQPHRNTTTDENGKFVIENMCRGRIQIQSHIDTPRSLHARVETEGGATDIRIVLAEVNRSGRAVPRQAPSLVGKKLPKLRDISVVFDPEQHKNKKILVCFWDMNQRPSRNCIIQLADRFEQLSKKGVTVVAIQASKVDNKVLGNWIRENDIHFPIGKINSDEEKIRSAWGVRSLPWLILTDSDHIVRKEGFGLSELDSIFEPNK